jgi:Mrp family chromosome partitioning ATPase
VTLPALPVLTAVTGAWEAALVGGLERAGGDVVVVRRCVDLPDLIATAGTGQARAVVVSADLRRLDGEALSQLASADVAVVGLVDPGDDDAERRLRQLGVTEVLPADAAAADVAEAVARAVAQVDLRSSGQAAGGSAAGPVSRADLDHVADPARALPAVPDRARPDADDGRSAGAGRLVAVWGPTGAPGRTTVAVTLAAELAALGRSTLLVDADTYGGSVAQVLGLLDEAPGLAAAARAADHGTLDIEHLARAAPVLLPDLRVLTGIARPQRWPELRPAALARVFALARMLCEWTVVDCGFSVEQDEELVYDTATPRRNGATLVSLEQADIVVAVGAADPVGLQRLVRGLVELAELLPGGQPVVVVNRLRSSAVGGGAESRVRDALERYAGQTQPVLVPDDRTALDGALLAGRTLTETAPTSPARLAIADLALSLTQPASRDRSVTRRGARRAPRG